LKALLGLALQKSKVMNKKTAFSVIAKLYQNMGFNMVINGTNVPLANEYLMVVIE
jgi:hypothetical protein